ncbi:MAG TPA: peptide chain release factor aRF-1, partial [Candidatus Nanoarchaeia archaeon]|nr:peptide chain release factor aRF-1 [Candidatus Nanoarchaeia archaeon]
PNDPLARHKLKKLLKQMDSLSARHTELITVYVPPGYDLIKKIQQLQDEVGTASNIKSTATRKNVTEALEKMVLLLKSVGKTPKNGLAAFAGNVAEREGQVEWFTSWLEPPAPLNQNLYRCDKKFVTEPLYEMVASDDIYGLVIVDRRDATLAILQGKAFKIIAKTHSEVPGKFKAGGQSAARFGRIREDSKRDHFKKVAEIMKNEFLNLPGLKGIILGGPETTVVDFLNQEYITGDVQKKILGYKPLSYSDEFGIQELLDKASDLLGEAEVADEKKIMTRFFETLQKRERMVDYGLDSVRKKLEMGAVEVVLISEALDDKIAEELEELAKQFGTEVKIISTDTREGVQLREIGKVAAILRYEVS